ncbi:MAG TPA: hypothetical protein VJ550_07095 [Geomonas sp.]|nr:hypothetical protein [Geomonas sp.]
MTRHLVIVTLALFLAGTPASILAAELQTGVPVDSHHTPGQDKAKDDACECCQKCKAAKSPIKSHEKEGHPLQDGCEDCCSRCGEALKPAPEAAPPEKIEKKVPLPEAAKDNDESDDGN